MEARRDTEMGGAWAWACCSGGARGESELQWREEFVRVGGGVGL